MVSSLLSRLPSWSGEAFRFLIGAALNVVVGYGSYLLLLQWLNYVPAYAIAYVIGIVVSYVFSALVVFRQPLRARAALSYPLVYVLQFLLGLVLLKVLVEAMHIPAWLGPLVVSVLTLPLTFVMSRIIVRMGASQQSLDRSGPFPHTPNIEISSKPTMTTNKPVKPEFDQYAHEYTDLHEASIRASGEDPAYFAAYKAKYMAAHLGPRSQTSVLSILDFGCGIGNTISHLRRVFPKAQLHGADLSGESIQLANKSHAHEATFRAIEDSRLPYTDQSFDVAVAACVFHHIPPAERAYWMSELRRVLKPGGVVFVFEHNVLNPLTVKAVKDCPFDADAILLPRAELLKLARQNTFDDVSARYIVFFPRILAVFRPLEPIMGWIPVGAQYVVQAVAP